MGRPIWVKSKFNHNQEAYTSFVGLLLNYSLECYKIKWVRNPWTDTLFFSAFSTYSALKNLLVLLAMQLKRKLAWYWNICLIYMIFVYFCTCNTIGWSGFNIKRVLNLSPLCHTVNQLVDYIRLSSTYFLTLLCD